MLLLITPEGQIDPIPHPPTPAAISDALGGAIPCHLGAMSLPFGISIRDDAADFAYNPVATVLMSIILGVPTPIVGPAVLTGIVQRTPIPHGDGELGEIDAISTDMGFGLMSYLMQLAGTIDETIKTPATGDDPDEAVRIRRLAVNMGKVCEKLPDGYPNPTRMIERAGLGPKAMERINKLSRATEEKFIRRSGIFGWRTGPDTTS